MTDKICIIDGKNPLPSCHAHHIHDHHSIRKSLKLDDNVKMTLSLCKKIKDKDKRNLVKNLLEN